MSHAGTLIISVLEKDRRPDDLIRQLNDELRRGGVRGALVGEAAPTGAKSAAGTLASIAVSGLVSAASVRAISQILLATIRRSEKRRIEIRQGDQVFILDGSSAADGRSALEAWLLAHAASPTGQPDDPTQVTQPAAVEIEQA